MFVIIDVLSFKIIIIIRNLFAFNVRHDYGIKYVDENVL